MQTVVNVMKNEDHMLDTEIDSGLIAYKAVEVLYSTDPVFWSPRDNATCSLHCTVRFIGCEDSYF